METIRIMVENYTAFIFGANSPVDAVMEKFSLLGRLTCTCTAARSHVSMLFQQRLKVPETSSVSIKWVRDWFIQTFFPFREGNVERARM